MQKSLTPELMEQFRNSCLADPGMKARTAAAAKTELDDIAFLPMEAAKLNGAWAVEVKTRGICAQMKSGRCWMFAALNILREQVADKCNLDEFELSQNYSTFFDKLEKCNTILQTAIDTADKPLDDHMVEYILLGFHDGGYWDQAADLILKYGIVPKSVMPESYQSSHTARFRTLANTLMRKDIAELRHMIADGQDPYARKEEMLAEIYRIECVCFGTPVSSFDFEYKDKDGNYHCERNLTPKAFLEKYTENNLKDYVTVTCEPTHKKPMNSHYVFHYIGSMMESQVNCINLPIEELESLAIAQLKDGRPVWFGNDSDVCLDRTSGVWDPGSFDYSGLFGGVDFFINKTDRLEMRDSMATHAMILVGVNFGADGQPDRWKIENSWGGELGKKGYFVCSERYFKDYVYEVIVDKKYLSTEQLALYESEPMHLLPWEE